MDENPPGPLQTYDTPGEEAAVRDNVCPWHTGLFDDITGAKGSVPTARLAFAVAEPQALLTVTDTVEPPGVSKHTWPGTATSAFAGIPLGNTHA